MSRSPRPDAVRAVASARAVRIALCAAALLAVAALLAAPAGAAPTLDDGDVTVADNESRIGIEEDHTVTVSAADVDTTGGPATVAVELTGWSADAIRGSPTVTVTTANVSASNVGTSGTETTFEVNDTDTAVIDFEAEIEYTLDHPRASSLDGADYGVDAAVTDADGTASGTASVSLLRLSYAVDGDERFPPDTEFVFENQAVTVRNLDPGRTYTLFEFDPESESLGDPIRSIDPGGSTTATVDTDEEDLPSGWYIVYDGSDVAVIEENAFQVRTQTLRASQASGEVDATGDGAETSVTIDSPLRTTAFDVNVTSPQLDAEELLEVFEGDSSADVERVDGSTIVLRNVTAGDAVPMTFAPASAATYEFDFEARDTGAADGSTVTVVEREADAEFGSDVFRGQAGGIVEISVSTQDTGDVYVMIGGDRSSRESFLTNYFDILHVPGDTTISVNTRLMGTNVPSEEVYATDGGSVTSYMQDPNDPVFDDVTFEGADGFEAFRSEIGVSDVPRPLQPERYRLVAGLDGEVIVRDDGVPDFERPLARSNVHLTESDGFGNVTTYIAPKGAANDVDSPGDLGELTGELTERRTVAKGDRLVFEIEARGITGLVTWLQERLDPNGDGLDPATLERLLAFPDGLRIDAEQTNPGINERITSLSIGDAANGELYVVPAPETTDGNERYIDRYYLVVDTRGTGPFDREPEDGDEYRFRFGYDAVGETDWFDAVDHDALDPGGAPPHFPYYDADADNRTEARTVTIEAPTVEYDRLDDEDRPVFRNGEAATISGVTNVAPGSEVSIQLVADDRKRPTKITIDDVDIADDGTFSVTHDLSALEPGEAVEIEFYVDEELLDKRSATVVDADAEFVDYRIVDTTENATVTAGEPLDAIATTVENTGEISDRRPVAIAVGDATLGEEPLALDGGETGTVEFGSASADLDPGEYNYTVSTDDDEATGRLVVEPVETDADNGTDDNGTEDDVTEDNSTEAGGNTTDGGTPADDPLDTDPVDEDPVGDPLGPLGELFGAVPPLPVGPRHAVGGAAVVGTAHVLGYWG